MIVFSINISLWSEGLILSNVWDSLTNDPWSVMSVVDTCVSSVTCLQCEERGHWWLRSRWQWWPVSVSAQSPLAAQVPHTVISTVHIIVAIILDEVAWVASPSGCRILVRDSDQKRGWNKKVFEIMDMLVWCFCLKGEIGEFPLQIHSMIQFPLCIMLHNEYKQKFNIQPVDNFLFNFLSQLCISEIVLKLEIVL